MLASRISIYVKSVTLNEVLSNYGLSGFSTSTVPYWNYYKLLKCHYNCNTHNVAFCIFSCRTLNNFCKLLVTVMTCNEKQTD